MQIVAAAVGRALQVWPEEQRKHRSPPDLFSKHSPEDLPAIADRTQPTQGTARRAPWARRMIALRKDFVDVLGTLRTLLGIDRERDMDLGRGS